LFSSTLRVASGDARVPLWRMRLTLKKSSMRSMIFQSLLAIGPVARLSAAVSRKRSRSVLKVPHDLSDLHSGLFVVQVSALSHIGQEKVVLDEKRDHPAGILAEAKPLQNPGNDFRPSRGMLSPVALSDVVQEPDKKEALRILELIVTCLNRGQRSLYTPRPMR